MATAGRARRTSNAAHQTKGIVSPAHDLWHRRPDSSDSL